MDFPTNWHKECIEYMTTECNNYGLSLLLEGSLAKNLGFKFSDIDLKELCSEVKQSLFELYHINLKDGNMQSQMQEALKIITDKENVNNEIIELFDDLFISMK